MDHLKLIGNTFEAYQSANAYSWAKEESISSLIKPSVGRKLCADEPSIFKYCEWTPDGSSIVTSSEDFAFRLFIAPQDLLTSQHPHSLLPYQRIFGPSPLTCLAVYPYFNLASPSTCVVALSRKDLPVQLYNAVQGTLIGSFPWIYPHTEGYRSPISMTFNPSGQSLICGCKGQISLFDINFPGCGPTDSVETNGGLISAIQFKNLDQTQFATGSYDGTCRLYDLRQPEIADPDPNPFNDTLKGITQILFSSDDRFMYIIRRDSDGVAILDVRQDLRQIATLGGWNGRTQQRLRADFNGSRLIVGSITGEVVSWDDAALGIDCETPDSRWICHEDGE